MKLSEFRHGEKRIVRLVTPGGGPFTYFPQPGIELSIRQTEDGEFLVFWEEATAPIFVRARRSADHQFMLLRLDQSRPFLARNLLLDQPDRPNELLIELCLLERTISTATMSFGVDEKIQEQISKRLDRPEITLDEVCAYLYEDLILPPLSDGLGTSSPGGGRWVVRLSGGNEESTFTRFTILGAKHSVDIRREGQGEHQKLLVDRLVWAPKTISDPSPRPFWLLQGEVRFVDATVGAILKSGAYTNLDELVQTSSSYLNLWRSFQGLEEEKLRNEAKSLGAIRYRSRDFDHIRETWTFKLDPMPGQADELQSSLFRGSEELVLEADQHPPDWEQLFSVGHDPIGRHRHRFSGNVESVNSKTGELSLRPNASGGFGSRGEPPEEGWLYLAMIGDEARVQRRRNALEKIIGQETPITTLGLLIERQAAPFSRHHSATSLSRAAKDCFHGGNPTEAQIQAIKLALNTPDIAIIQGPPGTGKTRTIAAIVQRLNELAAMSGEQKGRYLLTSFQHDAVDTVAAATSLMGLPTIRSGRKKGLADQSGDHDNIDQWVRNLTDKLEAELSGLGSRPLTTLLKEIQQRHKAYVVSPGTKEHASGLLVDVARLIRDVVDQQLVMECREQARKLVDQSLPEDHDQDQARRAAEGLRTCAATFSDDGPRNANRMLRFAAHYSLSDEDVAILETASRWDEDSQEEPEFLPQIEALKERLLDLHAQEGNLASIPLANKDVCDLLERITEALQKQVRESPEEGPAAALESFIDELRNAPGSGRRAIERYSTLLAATCQGCASGKFVELLRTDETEVHAFDTVIVDEAARANPLDLLIPMSLARKRIILVGDHRQLPHLLEPEVEKELSSSLRKGTEEMIRESLFQRLFDHAKEMENETGVLRCVTLNRQYRMHPELADLVAEQFYRPYDEAFESPTDSEFVEGFEHGLKGPEADKLAIWRSVPHALGGEDRSRAGFSWNRSVEAKHTAAEAASLLQSAPSLSIGIISFYSAQVLKIMQELESFGIATRNGESGELVIAPNYQTFPPGETNKFGDHERLRVGTVDAFQGKEFDAVILSPVRSNTVRLRHDGPDNRGQRRKFGHLLLPNRMCVAMSRQRRLLVVVGDDEMFEHEAEDPANAGKHSGNREHPVPGLPAFLDMCRSRKGLYTPAT